MITIEDTLELQIPYPIERLCDPDKLLFFDIETTGFSGDSSNLYLIGCVYHKNGSWQLIQWFADRADAECEVLCAFFKFLQKYTALIHFNGDGFDIPYLLKRCRYYGLSYNFDGIESIDIYRIIRPYKKLLGLDSLKQKSIESFLSVCREDMFSGGQLIEVYSEYLMTRDERLYRLLILHNADDLKGMPTILPILSYHDFFCGDFTLKAFHSVEKTDIFGSPEQELLLSYESSCPQPLPVPVQAECSIYSMELYERAALLTVPLYSGELKHFYPDYQNYFYLIYEDNAIHKSVGQYVEKNAKKKATAKLCYTRASGLFLPQPAPVWEPCLKADYKDKQLYTHFKPELMQDVSKTAQYFDAVLKNHFIKSKTPPQVAERQI